MVKKVPGHIVEDEPVEPESRVEHLEKGPVAAQDETEQNQEAPGSDVSDELLLEDVDRQDSWLQYNKGLEQTGFSPASQLTPDNVDSLSHEYTIETDTQGLQTNPIVVPGDPPVMYFTQTNQVVQAINARTGQNYWTFNYSESEARQNRGVSVWEDKVYFSAGDLTLIALDRYTGEKQWETKMYMDDEELPQQELVEEDRIYSTQAPLAFDGKIIIGQSGDGAGWTAVTAVDAESGEIVWQRRTAPKDEWVDETWKFSSSASWMSPTVDPESETVLFPVGNPDPMHNGVVRPGPNKLSNSVLALDTNNGEIKWNHQIVPHDVWDYDVSDVIPIADIAIDGERRRVAIQDWKAAWSFIIDVETGELIDRTAPWSTQRHEFGRDPEGFLNLPPVGEENAGLIMPPRNGASEWPTNSYSRLTGMRYIGYTDNTPNGVYYDPLWKWREGEVDGEGGGETNISDEFTTSESGVKAIDLESGETVWKWETDDIDQSWESPNNYFPGGTVTTAGNLVFHGTPGGHLVALNAESGEQLWEADVGGRVTATPVVWDDPSENKQFITIAANDKVFTYSGGGS